MNANVNPGVRPRPLPLTLDPLPDEDWCGYLRRLARRLAIDERALRRYLGMRPSRYGDQSLREQGIAMTPVTRAAISHAVGLPPESVARMHVQSFDGGLLQFSPQLVPTVDPTAPPSAINSGGQKVQRCGWAHWRAHSHACPGCLAEDPTYWRLSWRLRWHVACPTHHLLIDEASIPAGAEVDHHVLGAQRRVLEIGRLGRARDGMTSWDLANQMAAYIEIQLAASAPTAPRRETLPTPRQLADLLPEAYRVATTGRSTRGTGAPPPSPNTAGLRNPAVVASVLARRGVPLSSAVAAALHGGLIASNSFPRRPSLPDAGHAPGDVGRSGLALARYVPQLMPMEIFSGALSDLCYPMRLHRGRSAASIACVVVRCGGDAAEAGSHLGLPGRFAIERLGHLIHALQMHGREEAFWVATRKAWDRLQSQRIDYGARRELADSAVALDTAIALVGKRYGDRTVRRWLTEYWAGNLVWRARGCATGRSAAATAANLDRKHGVQLREALEGLHASEQQTA